MNTALDISRTAKAQAPAQLFEELYERAFPGVALFVRKMNGSFEEAKDIFQDALVIYYEKQQDPGFTLQVSPEAYLAGIAKHLWARKFRQNVKELRTGFSEAEIDVALPDEPGVNTNRLLLLLETAGKKCMDLLRAFYYEKQTAGAIARRFGYSGERSATVQKYKCLEKLRETVKTKSISRERFLD